MKAWTTRIYNSRVLKGHGFSHAGHDSPNGAGFSP
jgi:hypothetical protein